MLLLALIPLGMLPPLLLLVVALLHVSKKRRIYAHQRRLRLSDDPPTVTIGVFHPYANGGGGGERVLYCALAALLRRANEARTGLRVLLYAGDDGLSAAALLERAAERFNLPELRQPRLGNHVKLVPLPQRQLLEPARYPSFTLFWQGLAHIRLALEAFREGEKRGLYPSLWIDTTGCAFSYLVAKRLYGCRVVAYVYYPMISTDMIAQVQRRDPSFNNSAGVAQSPTRSRIKVLYYRLFAAAYGAVGRTCADVVMVNSTWTYNHIKALWGGEPAIVYPPCGTMDAPVDLDVAREPVLLSISQFRPEKNHVLQLEALRDLHTRHHDALARLLGDDRALARWPRLVLLGSCRNEEDEARVAVLRERCADLGLSAYVDFVVNASFAELARHLATASVGLHTMHNEHFGISIVEMMAAGVLVVANDSGGPAADIVRPHTGFLARTAEEYADKILAALATPDHAELRNQARTSALRFSDQEFGRQFLQVLERVWNPSP